MNKIFLKIFLVALLFPLSSKAEKLNAKNQYNDVTLAQKLRQMSLEISSKGKVIIEKPQDQLDIFRALETSVAVALKEPTPVLLEALTLFSGELAYIDNSATVGRMLLPLWKKHSASIHIFSQKLDAKKRAELKRQIKVRLKESEEGNG